MVNSGFRQDFFAELREILTAHSNNVQDVLLRLRSYYENLNSGADANTIPYLLFSSGRNSLEMPFLFLGGIHPYILTILARSLIRQGNRVSYFNPSELGPGLFDELLRRLDEIEQEMKAKVPDLLNRMSEAHIRFVTRVSKNWVESNYSQEGRNQKTDMATTAQEDMNEFLSIFRDANTLRMEVINDIVQTASNQQTTQFLEALLKFLDGFTTNQAAGEDVQQTIITPAIPYQQFPPQTPRQFNQPNSTYFDQLLHQLSNQMNAMIQFPPQQFNQQTSPYWNGINVIYVKNLDRVVNSATLLSTFQSRYDSVTDAKVVIFSDAGRCKGFGFVHFADQRELVHAITQMQGSMLFGRQMRIGLADNNSTYFNQPSSTYFDQLLHQVSNQMNAMIQFPPQQFNQQTSPGINVIYVKNLHRDVTSATLLSTFQSRYDSVTDAKVVTFSDAGRCNGFGFVHFADQRELVHAITQMQGSMLFGRQMRIGLADNNSL